MRALSVPVVVSSVVLAGWLGGAAAQDVDITAPPGLNSAQLEQPGNTENLPPGTIPQPTFNSPGLVTGATLGELYTDNLTLASPSKPKQTSWITVVQPFVKAAMSGPRFSGLVDYTLNGYVYAGQAQHNQLAQQLNAQGIFTVVSQHLFVNGTLLYGQEVINNELPAAAGTFFLNNNHANVGMASLSPYWMQDLGNLGTMTLRYTRGRIVYNNQGISGESRDLLAGIPDVTSSTAQFTLVSPKYEAWGWNFEYSQQSLVPDNEHGVRFAVAKAGASYQLNTYTRLLVDAGKENRYLPDGTIQHLGAPFWDAGFDWSAARDNFNLLVGHRFYGRSTQLTWTHTAALLTTTVGYVEQPTDLNQQLLGQNPGSIVTLPPGIRGIPSLAERQVYLMKRALASAMYTMPTGRLNLTLYDELRTYFTEGNLREHVANASLGWLYNLGPFTTFTPMVGWQRYQFRDGEVSHNRYLQLVLVHQLNPDNFGSIKLRSDSRDVYFATPGAHGYRVNVIYFSWTHLF